MEDEKSYRVSEPHSNQDTSSDQGYNWGMLCHLSALLGLVWFPLGGHLLLPFGHLLGPLAVWLLKRKEYPYVDRQGKESLNFQISVTLYGILASILVFILVGFLLLVALAVADVVLVIIASVKASNGESYRYPFTIRFVK